MSKVVLVRCESYEYDAVKAAVKKGIEMLGGAGQFASEGEKILLKPNILVGDPPERCSTTNPAVMKAVGEVMQETHAKLSFGDSPGFGSPESASKKAGLFQVASELNIPLADFQNGSEIFFEEAAQNKKFVIANGVLESDGLISISKMKTHGFAKMTGAIKNQFGCIPGVLKGEFHVKLPNIMEFARMLVDLNLFLKPRLYVMDGILAMEGNGPRGGNPKPMNVLLFSAGPIALDATVCRMIGLEPELVPTIKLGQEAGLGNYKSEEIELLGDSLESFFDQAFVVNKDPVTVFQKGRFSKLSNILVPKPYIIEEKCVKCGVCVNMCPVNPKAVDFHDGNRKNPPTYKYDRCIRCYCCQELCPEKAIELKVPALRRLLSR